MLKISFVLLLAATLLNTAYSTCFASSCPMMKAMHRCCHEASMNRSEQGIKTNCCSISRAPQNTTAFLKTEADASVLGFSSMTDLNSVLKFTAPLTAMAFLSTPLPSRPQKTVLRI